MPKFNDKYTIGFKHGLEDEIFFIKENVICSGIIKSINVHLSMQKDSVDFLILSAKHGFQFIPSTKVFDSKEELLASL